MAPLAAPAAPPASPRAITPAEYEEASHSQYTYSYDEEEPAVATPAAPGPGAAPAPARAPGPGAATDYTPLVPGESYEASQYYDLSQYEHYEQPATDDAASRALLARLSTPSSPLDGDGKPRT